MVCTPRPLTRRSPAAWVSANRASCACGKADPKTMAAVVPAATRRGTKSRGRADGERLVGQPRLGREDAVVQPLQQPAAAVRVGGVGLREVQVGVHEAGQQEVGAAYRLAAAYAVGRSANGPDPRDAARVADDERPVGQRDQRRGRGGEGAPDRRRGRCGRSRPCVTPDRCRRARPARRPGRRRGSPWPGSGRTGGRRRGRPRRGSPGRTGRGRRRSGACSAPTSRTSATTSYASSTALPIS